MIAYPRIAPTVALMPKCVGGRGAKLGFITFVRQIDFLTMGQSNMALRFVWNKIQYLIYSWKKIAQPNNTTVRSRRGFTLVEILVVLTIIGLVMSLVGPRVLNVLSDAKAKTAKVQIQNINSALELFYVDSGRYPTPEEGLSALVQRPNEVGTWNGPYVRGKGIPKDPWGNAYIYNIPGRDGEAYQVSSQGPNGQAVVIDRGMEQN